jgi:hypothetical protein
VFAQAIQKFWPFKRRNALPGIGATELSHSTANLSHPPSNNSIKIKIKKGRRIMVSMNLGSLPLGNPCAQCGKPIAAPEWVESGPGRTSYLWHCWGCDYTFEAVAFFEESHRDNEALAA